MHIESTDRVARPASEVFPLVRDRLPELLPYLPDVERIERLSYQEQPGNRVAIVNRWTASTKPPAAVARFLPPDLLVWTDTATWRADDWEVDYRLEGFGYEVVGVNRFAPDGDGTLVKIQADITLHPDRFKIPKLVFNKVFPHIEGLVKDAVRPNLTALARGLQAYYADAPR